MPKKIDISQYWIIDGYILGELYDNAKLNPRSGLTFEEIFRIDEFHSMSKGEARKRFQTLKGKGLIKKNNGKWFLTQKGRRHYKAIARDQFNLNL